MEGNLLLDLGIRLRKKKHKSSPRTVRKAKILETSLGLIIQNSRTTFGDSILREILPKKKRDLEPALLLSIKKRFLERNSLRKGKYPGAKCNGFQ